ncbi:MAG: endopolygalacturonase [Alistipes sp.]|nr:endopolygalacturonase [Alistipes sp.]
MKPILMLLCVLWSVSSVAQSRWVSQDNLQSPMQERLQNKDYEVELLRDGKWHREHVYGALTSNYDRHLANHRDFVGVERNVMGFVMFTDDFQRPVKVRVRRRGVPFQSVEIRPSAYRINPRRIDSNTVEFTLRSPREKVSVEFDGDRSSNIFILPDKPVEPPLGDSVIYFGRGEHEVGEVWLKSGQTLFLDEGAVVYGQLRASAAHDIKVVGRGVFCGSRADHGEHTRNVLVNMEYCRNIEIEGVMFRDSPSWTLRFLECEGVHIDNVKQIGWMINSDGVDLCNTRHVVVENCLLRNYDDNLSLKAFNWWDGMSDTYDVTMRNCVLWADCAHNFLVGPEAVNHKIYDVRFQRSIILESREANDPWRGAMAVMISDEGEFEDILFEDIDVEDIRGGVVMSFDYGKYNSRGRAARNITVRNVRYRGTQAQPSVIRGWDENHTIENITLQNVRYNGERITEKNLTEHFHLNQFVRGLNVGR